VSRAIVGTYYTCRLCGSGQGLWQVEVVLVLDDLMRLAALPLDSILRIYWLTGRTLYDFDEVLIVQASDEQVERLAVQIGNDTDPIRQPRYQGMRCNIAPSCPLSANTVRILQQMFAQVTFQPDKSADRSPETLRQLGEAAYERQAYGQALLHFTEVIRREPAAAWPYYQRGLAHQARGEQAAALADYQQAIALGWHQAEVYRRRADAYHALGEYALAFADYTQAFRLESEGKSL
jgi:tetratricopeptide (TPR) repeat protein